MGQKVHPVGLRLGIIRDWDGRWFAEKDYATFLHEDIKIRRLIKEKLYNAGIARVEIERAANRIKVTIHTARPGMVIGRGGTEVEKLRKELEELTSKQIALNIAEVKTRNSMPNWWRRILLRNWKEGILPPGDETGD